ncbi:MAG: hypothetical protein K2N34_13230, partial [Lachnospiraceae bacterium]|nr:hypothetical protein [Lachnospiraceae bacterium]
MKIYDDHIDVFTAVWSDEKQGTIETLIVHNEFGMKDKEEAHLQILCHEWKKSVLINGECIFTMDESERTVGKLYIDTWQTGLTFVDPLYTEPKDSASFKENYDELLWKECINKTEQQKLAEVKTSAKTEIEGYITDLTVYSEANQAVIAELISSGKNLIDACESMTKVSEAVEEIKLNLNAVKTIEREQFEADATAAKEEIEGYITDLTVYSEDNKAAIAKLIRDGKLLVDAADSLEEIQAVVSKVKEDLDAVLTIEEEEIARANAFKDALVDEIPNVIENYVSTDGNKVIFDTKNQDSTIVRFGNQDGNKWAVLDTKLVVDYRNTNDSILTLRFRAWDTQHGYKMMIYHDHIEVYSCTRGIETLIMRNAYGIENETEVHIQILAAEWKKAVLLNDECIFAIEEDAQNAGRIFVETWKTGVTFVNPIYKEYTSSEDFDADYDLTLLDTPCINKSEAQILAEYKENVKPEIEGYITDLTIYSEANQQVIANIIAEGKGTIDGCNTKADVDQAIVDIKKELDAVLTLEREAFLADINAAIEEIEGYITDLTLYTEANQQAIADIIADGKLDINAVTSASDIPAIVASVKENLDAVLTIAEEGALRAQTFNDLLVAETTNALDNVSVVDNKVVFDTAVAGNSTIVRLGTQDGKNHVALDTKIIVNYNNTTWDSLTIRFRAWDTNDGYRMEIKDSSIVVEKCKWGVDPEVVVSKDFGIKNGEETHLQILCSGWQKTVLINGKVIFSYSESERTVGYTYIQTWETGLTFIDPVYTEYPDSTA